MQTRFLTSLWLASLSSIVACATGEDTAGLVEERPADTGSLRAPTPGRYLLVSAEQPCDGTTCAAYSIAAVDHAAMLCPDGEVATRCHVDRLEWQATGM